MNNISKSNNRARLLIVDDDEAARFTLAWVFRTGPWEVTTASSARKAIQLAERNEYQLVILDYLMPDMNGIEAARKLQRICPAPILLCSAHLNDRRKRIIESEPAITRVIDKPVTPASLRAAAKELTGAGKSQDFSGAVPAAQPGRSTFSGGSELAHAKLKERS